MKYFFATLALFPTLALANFTDVSPTHLYAEAINYLKAERIVEGYRDGSFKPARTINRAEFTKIILEAQFTPNQINTCNGNGGFRDVQSSDWFAPYVCLAKKEGIVNGYDDKTFRPGNTILLTEASKILAESFNLSVDKELQPWYAPYLQRLTDLNVVPPELSTPEKPVTRGTMAEMIYRLKTNKVDKDASQIIFRTAREDISPDDFDDDQRQAIVDLTNAARAEAGLSSLRIDATLNQVAQAFAQSMDQQDFFGHLSPNGDSPADRVRDAGYQYRFVGENIAKGQVTADFAFQTWQESPGHWANILKPEYEEIGIGQFKVTNDQFYKGYFWVQVFGTKK